MSENFGLKIGLDGEKKFKKSLAEINNSFKVLGSEMKPLDYQFDKNDKSTEALTAHSEVLNKEIDQQKQKIETLRSALANAAESFGENGRRTQSRQIQLNNAQAALNGIERVTLVPTEPPLKKPPKALTKPEMKPRTSPIPSRKPTKPARMLTES